jgi:hypothetical protein
MIPRSLRRKISQLCNKIRLKIKKNRSLSNKLNSPTSARKQNIIILIRRMTINLEGSPKSCFKTVESTSPLIWNRNTCNCGNLTLTMLNNRRFTQILLVEIGQNQKAAKTILSQVALNNKRRYPPDANRLRKFSL